MELNYSTSIPNAVVSRIGIAAQPTVPGYTNLGSGFQINFKALGIDS